MVQDLSGKIDEAKVFDRPLSKEEIAGLAAGDPFKEHGLNATGKRLCGMCGRKAADKGVWRCTLLIDQLSHPKNYLGKYFYPCPAPEGDCPGFLKKPSVIRSPQPKKKGLPVPAGVKFLYFGAPQGKTKKGVPQHQGVATVAWIESSPGTIVMGFSFCSPEDPWCKITGREFAMKRLYEHPLVMPYLYSPKRTVHETVRAVLTHDFQRIAMLSPGATMLGTVPSWTKGLARRLMGGTERDRRGKTLGDKLAWLRAQGLNLSTPPLEIELPLTIIARMMRDIAALGNG